MAPGKAARATRRAPLHACPVCTRKLCWDLKLDPVARFRALIPFYRANGLDDEAEWASKAADIARAARRMGDLGFDERSRPRLG